MMDENSRDDKEQRRHNWQNKQRKHAQRPGTFETEHRWSRKGMRMINRGKAQNKKKQRSSKPTGHKCD